MAEKELKKLKELERQLTLIRDDFSGYGQFVDRNIKQAKQLVAWEESFKDLIEAIESLDLATDTEKERDGLKLKLVNIIKMSKPRG